MVIPPRWPLELERARVWEERPVFSQTAMKREAWAYMGGKGNVKGDLEFKSQRITTQYYTWP